MRSSDRRSLRAYRAVQWLQAALTPEMSESEAAEHFKTKIMESVTTRRDRVYRDLAHIWAH